MPVSRDPYLGSHIITKKPINNEMWIMVAVVIAYGMYYLS